ncbi:MAG: pseudouridylate synthase [Bacteroidaceae bacterium]|nr:pseudouridylate synthase [Bacteroidaceae bacterium]MBR7052345.1 pseudouridylate synthase [Bacteroidaceae bacterium]
MKLTAPYLEATLRKIDIRSLLPQRDPFVAVDRLVHYDDTEVVTETLVKADSLFTEDGRLTAAGLMENIAQTCAARIGFRTLYVLGLDKVDIGVIGALRNMEIHALPLAGQTLTTRVTVKEEAFGITLVEASVTSEGQIMAEGEMKIALKNEDKG